MKLCVWCLEPEHQNSCPQFSLAVKYNAFKQIEDPKSDAEDAFDVLRDRMHGYRTFAGQLARLLKEHAIAVPQEIAALNPDSYMENA